MTIDLDAYFERIGYEGDKGPSLQTLQCLHRLHVQAIPFENLDPYLGLPVHLDPHVLERKLVRSARGGYCFEQNLLLLHVLKELGYEANGLAARVLWHAGQDARPPATHMLLRVSIEGQDFIADVGFGGQVLTAPVRLQHDVVQTTPHEPFRLKADRYPYVLEAKISGAFRPIYGFDLSERLEADYAILNDFLSTSPKSPFTTGLMVARPAPGCRWTLSTNTFRDRQFSEDDGVRGIATLAQHQLNGSTMKRELFTKRELVEVLRDTFHIDPMDRLEMLGNLQEARLPPIRAVR